MNLDPTELNEQPSRAQSPGMDFVSADWVSAVYHDSPWAGACQTIVNCLQFGQLGKGLPI